MDDMKRALPMEHFGRIRLIPIQDECFRRTLGILSRKHHCFSAAKSFYKKLLAYFKTIDAGMNHPL